MAEGNEQARPCSALRSPSRIHITELERSDHANPTPLMKDSQPAKPGSEGKGADGCVSGRVSRAGRESANWLRDGSHLLDNNSGDGDVYADDYLSPAKLRQLSGLQELGMVTFLEMRVDTREHSLGNFGSWLPGLRQLKLNHSVVATVRDLGTALNRLEILWMASCSLKDLDGISALSGLRELYLAFNEVSELSSVSLLDDLQVIDLEGNNVDDISQVGFLALCLQLDTLTLSGNPCCSRPDRSHPDPAPGYDYRATVKRTIPGLRMLDDETIDNRSGPRPLMSTLRHSASHSHIGLHARPATSRGHQSVDVRDLKSVTELRRSSTTSSSVQLMGADLTSLSAANLADLARDDSSDMTYGTHQVFCGNLSKALRKRRKSATRLQADTSEGDGISHTNSGPTAVQPVFMESEKDDVVADLRAWKDDFERGNSLLQHASQMKISPIKSAAEHSDMLETPAQVLEGNQTQQRTASEPAERLMCSSQTDIFHPTPPKDPQPRYRRRLPARPMTARPEMVAQTAPHPTSTRRKLPAPPPLPKQPYMHASKEMVLPRHRVLPVVRPATAQPKLQRSASLGPLRML